MGKCPAEERLQIKVPNLYPHRLMVGRRPFKAEIRIRLPLGVMYCGVEQWSAHQPHKLEVAGSNPASRKWERSSDG